MLIGHGQLLRALLAHTYQLSKITEKLRGNFLCLTLSKDLFIVVRGIREKNI